MVHRQKVGGVTLLPIQNARGAARRGHGKVDGDHRWGSAKVERVTDGAPEKGRRGYTFIHTERASVATIYLSDHMYRICGIYTKYIYI
jgi:hypothetical protein